MMCFMHADCTVFSSPRPCKVILDAAGGMQSSWSLDRTQDHDGHFRFGFDIFVVFLLLTDFDTCSESTRTHMMMGHK